MPTERRLINKKAYEEMVLLKRFCDGLGEGEIKYCPALQLNDLLGEEFVIVISDDITDKILDTLSGKNYNEITKALMEYLNER